MTRFIKQTNGRFVVMSYRNFRALAHAEASFGSKAEAEQYMAETPVKSLFSR